MKRITAKVLVLLAAAAWCSQGHALNTDRHEPINIEADWAEADDKHRTTTYRGAVVITQGSIRITGDKVTMYYDESNSLAKLVAVGNPARFRQLPDGKTEYQRAKAQRMEYHADRDVIILLGAAHSWRGQDRVSADRIVFDTLRSRIKAETDPSVEVAEQGKGRKSRVRITIAPKKK